jgi:hypothetical protein
MPRATCRCGQVLSVPVVGPDRVICPKCSSRVRVRRDAIGAGDGDGFIRFLCTCGRRLKVRADAAGTTQQSGRCPDCHQVVPVPSSSSGDDLRLKGGGPDSPTEELDEDDLAALNLWSDRHSGDGQGKGEAEPRPPSTEAGHGADADADSEVLPPPAPIAVESAPVKRAEAGLRVCTRCGRPLHLSAVACRECGAPAPRR